MEDLFNKNTALLKGLYRCAFFTVLRANRIAKKRKSKEYFVDPDIYLETVEELTDLNLAEMTAIEFTKEPKEESAHYIKNWWYWLGMYTLALFELSRSTKIIYDNVDLLRERGISVSEPEIELARKQHVFYERMLAVAKDNCSKYLSKDEFTKYLKFINGLVDEDK